MAAAALAAAWGSVRWLPLHLFLAGAVVLTISGVSLMLTVTWAAAPAPPNRWVSIQRGCIAAGAAGIAVGRTLELPTVTMAVAGALYIVGLGLLGVLLAVTVRRGVQRRFDTAVAGYLVAIVAGLVGVGLGISMAVDTPLPTLRSAHTTTNLLGMVGIVVFATLPFFAATVGRARMAPQASLKRLALTLGWQTTGLALAVGAFIADEAKVAAVGLAGYALGVLAVLTVMPRPTRRQMRWAGPRLLALWVGATWWAVAVAATAAEAAEGRAVFAGRWLLVLVVAGYAQILWGSLAYLLPMLRGGGPDRLGEGFAATRSWPGFVAVNLAGLAAACSWEAVVVVAIGAFLIDGAWRAARVGTVQAVRTGRD